jgi:hypothetical protein
LNGTEAVNPSFTAGYISDYISCRGYCLFHQQKLKKAKKVKVWYATM